MVAIYFCDVVWFFERHVACANHQGKLPQEAAAILGWQIDANRAPRCEWPWCPRHLGAERGLASGACTSSLGGEMWTSLWSWFLHKAYLKIVYTFYISFYILLSPFLDGVCSGAGQCLLKCCNLPWCRNQPVMIKGSHWRPQSARNECILRSNMTPSKMVQNTKVPRQSQATESDDVKSAGWGQCFIQWHGPTQCNAGRVMHRIRTRQHSLHDESSRCLTVCRTKIQSTNQSTSS